MDAVDKNSWAPDEFTQRVKARPISALPGCHHGEIAVTEKVRLAKTPKQEGEHVGTRRNDVGMRRMVDDNRLDSSYHRHSLLGQVAG